MSCSTHIFLTTSIVLGACDPLVEAGYYGTPLFAIDGRIIGYDYPEDPAGETPTASLFWSLTAELTLDPKKLIRDPSVTVSVQSPSAFELRVFDIPPTAGSDNRPYEMGQIIFWNDDDDNGAYSRSELRGGAYFNVVLYSRAGLPAARSPTGLELPAGFTVAELPMLCSERSSPFEGEDDCGVPLGSACTGHTDCGRRGRCVDSDGFIKFPDGYCVMPVEVACKPHDGWLVFQPDHQSLMWFRACTSDNDCPRSDYICATWSGTCRPRAPVGLYLTTDFTFAMQCAWDGMW